MPAAREPDDVYAAKVKLGPTITTLLNSLCKDQPDTLLPYMLAKLIEAYPDAAKDIGTLEPEATAWKKRESQVPMSAKKQLLQYLDDMRWSPTIGAISEQVIYKRPANAQAFMIEILAKGDIYADIEPAADTDAAAAKMQALQRGRQQRKKQAEAKAAAKAAEEKEQAEAAAKMQAARRGYADRKKVKEDKAAKELAAKEEEAKKEELAATKMQAMQRGNMSRKSASKESGEPAEAAAEPTAAAAEQLPEAGDPEMEAAAAKMQAAQRGKNARDEYLAARKEREAAATKMQALQRGKNARKSAA